MAAKSPFLSHALGQATGDFPFLEESFFILLTDMLYTLTVRAAIEAWVSVIICIRFSIFGTDPVADTPGDCAVRIWVISWEVARLGCGAVTGTWEVDAINKLT